MAKAFETTGAVRAVLEAPVRPSVLSFLSTFTFASFGTLQASNPSPRREHTVLQRNRFARDLEAGISPSLGEISHAWFSFENLTDDGSSSGLADIIDFVPVSCQNLLHKYLQSFAKDGAPEHLRQLRRLEYGGCSAFSILRDNRTKQQTVQELLFRETTARNNSSMSTLRFGRNGGGGTSGTSDSNEGSFDASSVTSRDIEAGAGADGVGGGSGGGAEAGADGVGGGNEGGGGGGAEAGAGADGVGGGGNEGRAEVPVPAEAAVTVVEEAGAAEAEDSPAWMRGLQASLGGITIGAVATGLGRCNKPGAIMGTSLAFCGATGAVVLLGAMYKCRPLIRKVAIGASLVTLVTCLSLNGFSAQLCHM